jgi:dTMP kinase
MYVVFEGIDGCGKSTQIELLKKVYPNAVFTKEPGGTDFGIKARELLLHSEIKSPKAELFLFLADRAEHYKEIIEPNLQKIVISDRGLISGIAYALTSGFELDFLIELNKFSLNNHLPQKVVLFKITKDELIKRVGAKEQDKIEQRGYDYLMQIQNNLIEVTKALNIKHIIVDATNSIEDIHKEIVDFLKKQ